MDTDPADSSSDQQTADSDDSVSERLIEGLSSHAVFMLDTDGTITTWPEPAASLYGYDRDATVGQHVDMLFADPEEMETTVESLLIEVASGPVETQHWHRRADGSVFWATLSLSQLEDGELTGFVAVSQDTTEKHQYDKMLERQNDRLKEFTDILAHDLKSPLSVISSRVHLARETGDEEHLDALEETSDRMARLVEDLLRVARQGNVVTNPEATNVQAVVNTAWEGHGETTDRATLHYEDIGSVSADADRLIELFENLFQNSIRHGDGAVIVRVGPLDSGFYVEDDGPGIPDEVKDDVFDHGFTTAEDGSGYGLSIVRTIAGAHGWDILVTDSDTGGARFEITGVEFLD
ncbi:ATP-binding protein [Haloarcula marismortui]|uniref:histidine kinase n=1 Tax=Haloarcula marismortui ATCC 33800 TaxID=662476 RepID=M0K310_9EURY|nr:PAS domain-containing sensor histidine kinase [Haloarcula sinaiiensis]EMA15178.1 protein kinase-like protein [Haloarcula sinaiiensis ATCC 33800]QUJ71964.1 PAS domain S-box protein [Haloarcula sinaiiensis ATCC 33800]